MTTVQYLDEKIQVPDNWGDIKLRDYEGFYLDKPETVRDKVALVAKICKVDPELILKWPAEVFNIIVDKTYFIFQDSNVSPAASILINGITYKIPIEEKLTLGAYIDADSIQKEGVNVLSNILAIVCRPEGEEYNDELNEQRAEMFGALSVAKVQPLLGFFLHCRNVLDKRTTAFTNLHRAVELLPPSIKLSQNLGAGIKLFQMWQIIKYFVLMKLLNYRLRRFLHSSNTKGIKITQKMRKGS